MKLICVLLFPFIFFPSVGIPGSPSVVVSARFVKLEIKEDGKPTGWYMVVDLFVSNDGGKFTAEWNSVFIMPDDRPAQTRTVLRADHYSTDRGDIQNLVVTGSAVTFDLFRSPDRPVKIICVKRDDNSYDIEGSSFFWSTLLKKRVAETWSITKTIRLPSLNVYGQGD